MITHNGLKQEVLQWSQRIGVKPVGIHIREMKNKWASCSSKGRVTINSSILNKPDDFRSEVIVHELLHLKYPNHGKMFKALMRSYLNKG
jgi:hypothetical protein